MKSVTLFGMIAVCGFAVAVLANDSALAEIGVVSPREVRELIEDPAPCKRLVVLDPRRGSRDFVRGHSPTAHHLNCYTLRGTNRGVPVQYLPDDGSSR